MGKGAGWPLAAAVVVAAAAALSTWADGNATATWTASSVVRSLWPHFLVPTPTAALDAMEARSFAVWEGMAGTRELAPLDVPEVDFFDGARVALHSKGPLIMRAGLNRTLRQIQQKWSSKVFRDHCGDLEIDYFLDATTFNASTVPNARARVRDIIANISAGGPEKFGTELIYRRHPELLDWVQPDLALLNDAFGGEYFARERIGLMLTIPVFMAMGQHGNATCRTDLHAEPIANVVVQLEGRKKWTFALPGQSKLLRPSVSPDGRAYFLSSLHPHSHRFGLVERYEVTVDPGDVLWIPPWTWHRTDYIPGSVSVSSSFFHIRPLDMFWNNPLFCTLTVPNMLKELIGWKTQ